MNKRIICVVLTLALLATEGIAASKEAAMRGHGAGMITAPPVIEPDGVHISAAGEGEATHLGKYTREESIILNPVTGAITGSITFIAADGSELYCTFAGSFTGPTTAAGTYTFTGGTGRLENATGTAYFSVVQSDEVNFTVEWAGTIDF